jgi:hypothetical protein
MLTKKSRARFMMNRAYNKWLKNKTPINKGIYKDRARAYQLLCTPEL